MNLITKKRSVLEQCEALEEGRVPAGINPFKIGVDVRELDSLIPAEFCMLKIELNEGSTFREAKEKLHMAAIALNKAIDINVIEPQILRLKNHITCDVFITDVAKIKEERSSESAQLLEELGLGGTRIITPSIRRASAVQLYSSVIEKIARNNNIKRSRARRAQRRKLNGCETQPPMSSWMQRSEFQFLKLWR